MIQKALHMVLILILFTGVANASDQKIIGLFIASVDPITVAHMDVIEAGIEQLKLEKVIIMVNSSSDKDYSASVKERMSLVRAALSQRNDPNMEFEVITEPAEGKRAYAIRVAHEQGGGHIFQIAGEDVQAKAQELYGGVSEVTSYILPRLNRNETQALPQILDGFHLLKPKRVTSISSTEVKERLEKGLSVAGMLDSSVIEEIRQNGFYRPLSDADAQAKGTILLQKMKMLFADMRTAEEWKKLKIPAIENENSFVLREGVNAHSNLSFSRLQSMQASEELIIRIILKENSELSKSEQFKFRQWATANFSKDSQRFLNQKFEVRFSPVDLRARCEAVHLSP